MKDLSAFFIKMEEPYGSAFVNELIKICSKNAEYYEKDNSENGQRMHLGFLGIIDHVNSILPLVAKIEKVMATYDFDESTPGNGYRSFVVFVQACFKHALELCNYVAVNKDSIIFRKGIYVKEVEAIAHMIASLVSCFKHLCTLVSWSEAGELFPSAEHYSEVLLQQSDSVNQYAFYGRCLGIQFSSSIQPLLKMISIFMASFSEMYYNIGSFSATAQSLFLGGKFFLDPELRARRIVNISRYASIDFCKAFWFLTESELMKKIPDFICSSIAVNVEIQIPPEPLQVYNSSGVKVDIPIPSSHIPVNSMQVRLLSSSRRKGMIAIRSDKDKKNKTLEPSKGLIFHCHGGGFVAQSSKSHEVYLRDWACSLDVPIISVDYSLAPEAPYPRALEEVFYSYCWVLKNSLILGSTGENIVLAGDSAGANLLLGVTLKCIDYNIRKPNGLFMAYVPVIVSSTASPSRLLCLMDPLLPVGFLLRCLKAYACPDSEVDRKEVSTEDKEILDSSTASTSIGFSLNVDVAIDASSDLESMPAKDLNFSESSLVSTLYHERNLSVFQTVQSTSEECAEIISDFPPTENESERKLEEVEKNYKTAFHGMRMRVSSIVTNAFKLQSKDSAKAGSVSSKLKSANSFKDLKFSVPRDPYLSPYWASDKVLSQLPPTSICSVQFDPCLDDCVMFAKKLKKLGNVITLDILEGLPHGFLNLSKVNKNAEDGSKICIERIRKLLENASSPRENHNDINENLEEKNPIKIDS